MILQHFLLNPRDLLLGIYLTKSSKLALQTREFLDGYNRQI